MRNPLHRDTTATRLDLTGPREVDPPGADLRGRPVEHTLDGDRPAVDQRAVIDEPRLGRVDTDRPGDADPTERVDRAAVVAREKDAFGGVKIGSAFFGWLTATGSAVLLTALIAAAGTAIGVARGAGSTLGADVVPAAGYRADVAILVVMALSYYCGGYVAGRMARFNGIKQGVAVWLWGVAVGLLVAALGAMAGSRFELLATLNGFPRVSFDQGQLGHAVVTVLLALVAALAGAMLGGLAGMRFHRRVDRAGLGR